MEAYDDDDTITIMFFDTLAVENCTGEVGTRVAQLKHFPYHARYGDYMAALTKILKTRAVEHKSENRKILAATSYWTTMSAKLKKDSQIWKQGGSADVTKVPNTWGIDKTIQHVGIDFDATVNTIHLYAERNKTFR